VGRLLQGFLVQVGPADPLTLLLILGVLIGVALLACLWPARRAAKLDPVDALRIESVRLAATLQASHVTDG
jgi:putative ABC transport system permease protein